MFTNFSTINQVSRIPVVTRVACSCSLLLSLCSWLLRASRYLSLALADDDHNSGAYQLTPPVETSLLTIVPRTSYYMFWTLITASFVSSNIFTLGISITTLLLGGRYIERSFTSKAFLRYCAVLVLIPNVLILFCLIFLYLTTRNPEWLRVSVSGSVAIQAGILVAFKQLVPEHTVKMFKGLIKIRVKHFPALFILSTILTAPIIGDYSTVILAINGFFSGWTYLRFFETAVLDMESQTSSMRRGDASEAFAMSEFFPDFVRPPIDMLSSKLYDICSSLGMCSPIAADEVPLGESRSVGLGAGRAEAERRRTLALRVLDDRSSRSMNESSSDITQVPPQVNH